MKGPPLTAHRRSRSSRRPRVPPPEKSRHVCECGQTPAKDGSSSWLKGERPFGAASRTRLEGHLADQLGEVGALAHLVDEAAAGPSATSPLAVRRCAHADVVVTPMGSLSRAVARWVLACGPRESLRARFDARRRAACWRRAIGHVVDQVEEHRRVALPGCGRISRPEALDGPPLGPRRHGQDQPLEPGDVESLVGERSWRRPPSASPRGTGQDPRELARASHPGSQGLGLQTWPLTRRLRQQLCSASPGRRARGRSCRRGPRTRRRGPRSARFEAADVQAQLVDRSRRRSSQRTEQPEGTTHHLRDHQVPCGDELVVSDAERPSGPRPSSHERREPVGAARRRRQAEANLRRHGRPAPRGKTTAGAWCDLVDDDNVPNRDAAASSPRSSWSIPAEWTATVASDRLHEPSSDRTGIDAQDLAEADRHCSARSWVWTMMSAG
jgi:hypothetical protein